MPPIKEVTDSGTEPVYPTIEVMRKSQKDGSVGVGLAAKSFNEDLADNNQAPSINGARDDAPTPSGSANPLSWMP